MSHDDFEQVPGLPGPLPVGERVLWQGAPRWQALAGKAMHGALYALMIGMPLAGWVLLSAEGEPIPFFGQHLPALVAEGKTLADTVKEIHETGGTIGYFLIGLHAAAALFHHYVVRDNTLRRMLPNRESIPFGE